MLRETCASRSDSRRVHHHAHYALLCLTRRTSMCAVALVRGLPLKLLESSRVIVFWQVHQHSYAVGGGRPPSDPSSMHLLGTWRQRTESAKKEVCFMSGAPAAVIVNHSSQEMLLSHFGATVFYEALSLFCVDFTSRVLIRLTTGR